MEFCDMPGSYIRYYNVVLQVSGTDANVLPDRQLRWAKRSGAGAILPAITTTTSTTRAMVAPTTLMSLLCLMTTRTGLLALALRKNANVVAESIASAHFVFQ